MLRLKISVLAIVSIVVGFVVALLAPETHAGAMSLLAGVSTYVLGLKVPLLMGSIRADNDAVRLLIAMGLLDAGGGYRTPPPVAKTANYQIVAPTNNAGDLSGTVFTNRAAAGAVTFTLPAIVPALIGTYYDFWGVVAAQTIAVAAAAGTITTFNNAAAGSVTCSTAGQLIGAHIRAFCDGTKWIVTGDTVGVTYTVA